MGNVQQHKSYICKAHLFPTTLPSLHSRTLQWEGAQNQKGKPRHTIYRFVF